MGSSFSILNDTKHVVYVQQGTCWAAVMGPVIGISALLTAGAAAGGILALGAGTAIIGGVIAGETATALGMTATGWTITGIITGLSAKALAETLNITREEAEKIEEHVKGFIKDSTKLEPGETFTFSGTLSLVRTVYCMNDKTQHEKRDCWTGATSESNRKYTISENFSNLTIDSTVKNEAKDK